MYQTKKIVLIASFSTAEKICAESRPGGGRPHAILVVLCRVKADTNDYSNWAEIQAFGPDDSIYIPTSGEVSHQYWTFDESKHRDGNIDTFSHTYKDSTFALAPGKEDSGRSYAFIDLGNVRPISKIKLISREGYPDGNPRTSPHRVFLSHTWTNEYWGGAQVDIDNYVAMSSSSSYLISKNTVNNIQTTYTYDPSINENTLGSMQDVVTVQSDYTAINHHHHHYY